MQPPNQILHLTLLQLHFKTIAPINNLPFYHGTHWSALLRNVLKTYLPQDSLSTAGIWIHPIETGILSYEKDEPIHIGLTFPSCHTSAIARMLEDFNSIKVEGGHFQPGKTILLEKTYCRITGNIWNPEAGMYLTEDLLTDEVKMLSSLNEFTIHFHSPLRLPRPEGQKTEGHHYCDEEFFLTDSHGAFALNHIISKVRIGEILSITDNTIKISGGALKWLDVSYGYEIRKTMGGVVGKLKVSGTPNQDAARILVTSQYTGAGKNPVFGFGFYTIPELDGARKITPLYRGKTMLQRVVSPLKLRDALYKLPNSSPGPDMLTVDDIKKAGDALIERLSCNIIDGTYIQGELKKYRLPKDDGTFREIYVQNVSDRLVHRAAADCLSPVIDTLLSSSSYAYRRGLNRKGAAFALRQALSDGYTSGLKADISAFFDSVNIEILHSILEGLFPFEPLIGRAITYLKDMQNSGIKGLPQGSPLSPILSNLYLDRFDRDMEKEGFRLIRYADDFVVLFKEAQSHESGIVKIENSLSKLGLKLKTDKTTEIKHGAPIKFLGFLITPEGISEEQKEKTQEKEEWSPVFKEEWLSGIPVYLTSICRGAYSSGPSLIVNTEDGKKENIPWSSIGRVVVVGRSQFSGGVVYRAVKEEIPVTFIDVMGYAKGHLYPEYHELPEIISLQEQYSRDKEFCLSFAKEIISAKVHNSYVLLKRNSINSKGLKDMAIKAKSADNFDTLRGYEGAAAKIYFEELTKIVMPFEFKGRVYHPPDSPVNVMLSLGYTLLYNRLAAVLKDKGFNHRIGFFHKGRGAHAALASDLLEELRHIVERIALSLIHREEIREGDFSMAKRKGVTFCRLIGSGFRKYIHRFEVTMTTKSSYHGGEKLSCNGYLDEMADNLKRAIKLKIPYKALRIS